MNFDTYGTDPSKTFVRSWEGIVINVNQKCEDKSGKIIEPSKDKDQKDWGYRVQVRIFGEHTPDKTKLPDKDLPWVEVWVPAISGSGNQTPQIKNGDHVGGFYILNKPYLTFVKLKTGKEEQPSTQPQNNGFAPFSEQLPTTPVYSYLEGGKFLQGWNANIYSQADVMRMISQTFSVPCPKEILNVAGISTELNNLIKSVEDIKKGVNDFSTGALNEISRVQQNIQKEIDRYSEKIAGWIARAVKWIQEQITGKVNLIGQGTASVIPLNARFTVREGTSVIMEALYCFFNKILDNLVGMIADLLTEAIDYFVNGPLCFIENFLTNFFGTLFGALSSALNSIAGALSGVVSGVTSLLTGVLDIILDLLSLFTCDEDDVCPETKEWNILDAAGKNSSSITLDIESVINQALSVADSFANIVTTVYDPSTGSILGFNFDDFVFDITNSLSNPSCSGAPLFCGPPTVTFWGGGGSGASGNAIISAAGEILGIDIVTSGSGYVRAPFVDISDDCGNGGGVIAEAILGPVGLGTIEGIYLPQTILSSTVATTPSSGIATTSLVNAGGNCPEPEYSRSTQYLQKVDYDKIGVVGVRIISSGSGFISNYDGSLGGNGRIWASAEDTFVKRSNGKYDLPYKPGSVITLTPCDEVTPPNRIPFKVTEYTSYTAPPKVESQLSISAPISSSGKYPVLMYLCGVDILNSGVSYSKTDKIKIVPDNGAELIPSFNDVGALVKIDIIKSGSYVTQTPNIIIESSSGFNAKIIPLLCTKPVQSTLNNIDEIIEVIDCVGKI